LLEFGDSDEKFSLHWRRHCLLQSFPWGKKITNNGVKNLWK